MAGVRKTFTKGAAADALGVEVGGAMAENTRAEAVGAIMAAEKKIQQLPQALTLSFVGGVVSALLAVCMALRATVAHVDAIE